MSKPSRQYLMWKKTSSGKGEYVIYADNEEVVSTDSPFWASFFSGGN